MEREKFAGIVVGLSMDGKVDQDYVLREFVGEGNTSIVFRVSPRSNPAEQQWVLKFIKPDVRFELTVLHHSFQIAEELYPQHPLLMSRDERMRRLTDEMLGRIESDGVLFRVGAYRDLLMSTIQLLAGQYAKIVEENTSPRDLIRELGPMVPMVDDNLIQEIESNLDDDTLVNEFRPFFEQCAERLRAMIVVAKQDGIFRPIARSPLFKLFGLHLEDFINWGELLAISNSSQIQKLISSDVIRDFNFAVSALYFQASGQKDRTSGDLADSTTEETGFQQKVSAAMAAARYLDWIAMGRSLADVQGYARNWLARGLLLEEHTAEAIQAFEQALDVLATPESLAERHNALIDLASLLADSAPERAEAYEKEAIDIRRQVEGK